MSIDQSIAEELTRSGGPTAKWDAIGDVRRVVIASVEKRQVTDFDTGEPLTWPNGDPKWQFVFGGTDPDSGEETRIFAKGYMLSAVKEALRTANSAPEVGGTLAVKWTGNAEPVGRKAAAKQWAATYNPPAVIAMTAADLF
jgi:hypothetical protein